MDVKDFLFTPKTDILIEIIYIMFDMIDIPV